MYINYDNIHCMINSLHANAKIEKIVVVVVDFIGNFFLSPSLNLIHIKAEAVILFYFFYLSIFLSIYVSKIQTSDLLF